MQYLKEKQKTAGPVRRQKAKVSSEADAAMEYLKGQLTKNGQPTRAAVKASPKAGSREFLRGIKLSDMKSSPLAHSQRKSRLDDPAGDAADASQKVAKPTGKPSPLSERAKPKTPEEKTETPMDKSACDALFSGGDIRMSLQLMRDKTGIQRSASAKRCRAARKDVGPLVRTARSVRLPARANEMSGDAAPSDVAVKPSETRAVTSAVQTAPPKSPVVSPVLTVRHVLQETHTNVFKPQGCKPLSSPPSPSQWVRRSPHPQTRSVVRSPSPPAPAEVRGTEAETTVTSAPSPAPTEQETKKASDCASAVPTESSTLPLRSPPVPWQFAVGVHAQPATAARSAGRVEGVRSCHDGDKWPKQNGFAAGFGSGLATTGPHCGTWMPWTPTRSVLLPPGSVHLRPQQPHIKVARVCATPPAPMTPMTPIMQSRDSRDEAVPQKALPGRPNVAIPWFPKTDPTTAPQTPQIPYPQLQQASMSRGMFAGSPTRRRQINV